MSCEEHKVFGPIENLFDFLKTGNIMITNE